jgi:hypothetical protein
VQGKSRYSSSRKERRFGCRLKEVVLSPTKLMGLTHYWRRPVELEATVFKAAVADIKKVLAEFDIPLAGWDGKGKPVLKHNYVRFNGLGEDAHETFGVDRMKAVDVVDKTSSFCKTARKPYDMAVRVALIIFSHHFGDAFQVTSDDDSDDVSWGSARLICGNMLDYGDHFRLYGG